MPNEQVKQQTPCGDLSVKAILTSQTHAIELRHDRTNERIFMLSVTGRDEMTIAAKDQRTAVKVGKEHKGSQNHLPGKYAVVCPSPLGDLSFEWANWKGEPIPPNGVIGWLFLATAGRGALQVVTFVVGEDGNSIVAKVCSDLTHPKPNKYLTIYGRKESVLSWTNG